MFLTTMKKLLAGLSLLACTSAIAGPLTVQLNGINSFDELRSAANTVLTFNVGANAHVTSLRYDVNLTAYNPSWLSELGLAYTNSAISDGVLTRPGFGNDLFGTGSFTGFVDLIGLNLDFRVGADGILRLEFYETLNDSSVAPDGRWNSGTLVFEIDGYQAPGEVPEPASALLLAGGIAAMGYARRRRAKRAAH